MSGRRRSLVFAAGALACGALAAAQVEEPSPAAPGGELRAVVALRAGLGAGQRIGPRVAREALVVRRVPEPFAPPDALAAPQDAIGLRPVAALPAGAYLTASDVASGERRQASPQRPAGTTPVELTVAGAGALASAGRGARVDVVVAGAAGPGPGGGAARVAARGVRLLALERAPAVTGMPESWRATLALRRPAALALIRAEGLGREIRLLAR